MVSALNSALSGLNAATTRLNVSANNVANQQSTLTTQNGETVAKPFVPQDVVSLSQPGGGVATEVRDSPLPPIQVYQPDSAVANEDGLVSLPNVDPAEELVDTIIASYDFKANLQVLRKEDERLQNALDILA